MSKKMFKQVGKAIADFSMIRKNDKILVCLSGGKDSWALLDILSKLKKRAPIHFDVEAIKINPNKNQSNDDQILAYCEKMDVKLHIIQTNMDEIIAEKISRNKSYCAFCSRLRRGFIYTNAEKLGATKIALGHHREDFNETFLMNLIFGGQIKSMAPILKTDDKRHVVIRPLVYVSEDAIIDYAKKMEFPIATCNCGYSGFTEREKMKELMNNLQQEYPKIKETMIQSMSRIKPSHLLDKQLYNFDDIK
jgi:tRNA 2-thiocytidine biosynthesis protein TtcA